MDEFRFELANGDEIVLTRREGMRYALSAVLTFASVPIIEPAPPKPPKEPTLFSCLARQSGALDSSYAGLGMVPGSLPDGRIAPKMLLRSGGHSRYDFRGTIRETALGGSDGITWQGRRNLMQFDAEHDDACVSGGAFICPNMTPAINWNGIYQHRNAPVGNVVIHGKPVKKTLLEGVRLHGGFDGLQVSQSDSSGITARKWALSLMRDDAIENDSRADDLTIDDCLFDGVFVFFSCRNSGGIDGSERVNTVRNSLVRLQPMCIYGVPNRQTGLFKLDRRSVQFDLYDSVFAMQQRGYEHPDPFRSLLKNNKLRHASRNTICWLGDGRYPADNPKPGAFRILEGAEARDYWEEAVGVWWKTFPGTRFAFDPPAVLKPGIRQFSL